MQEEKLQTVLLGDSSIDNPAWVDPTFWKEASRDEKQSISYDPKAKVKKFRGGQLQVKDLSVVENLMNILGDDHEVINLANDGFTTSNCLGFGSKRDKKETREQDAQGEYRDKVFDVRSQPIIASIYPHERFKPLEDKGIEDKNTQNIVLSVGGNNIREFLNSLIRNGDGFWQELERNSQKQQLFKRQFDAVMQKLSAEYVEIVKQIRRKNPQASIILMTQYYPSFLQKMGGSIDLYSTLVKMAKAYGLKNQKNQLVNSPADVAHAIMERIYKDIWKSDVIKKDTNLCVVDATSSLDPFEIKNHVSQIEPSGEGGRKIAQMLAYAIDACKDKRKVQPQESKESSLDSQHSPVQVFKFLPSFFETQSQPPLKGNAKCVQIVSLEQWNPKHPQSFPSFGLYSQSRRERKKLPTSEAAEASSQRFCSNKVKYGSIMLLILGSVGGLVAYPDTRDSIGRFYKGDVNGVNQASAIGITIAAFALGALFAAAAYYKSHRPKHEQQQTQRWGCTV